ncbi:MAG: FAD-dependent monooxygenase [Pseudomonadota bacterium]
MFDADVVVVGAGPVGAVAAYRMAKMGLDALLLEGAAQPVEDLRASTIHPPTLEMLAELGVVDPLIEQGIKTPVYHFRERETGDRVAFDFSELGEHTPYPYRLQCEQYKIVRLLVSLLQQHYGREVRFSHRVESVTQDGQGVSVVAQTPDGVREFRSRYVIAADGGGSAVRKSVDVPFEGMTYPEKFVTFSTDTPLDRYFEGFAGVNYVADEREWASIILTPSGWRVLVPAAGELTNDHLVSDRYKNTVFHNLIGVGDSVETHHRTVYRVNQRVAVKYNHGRVILAGDSAHVHNPLGGFGMNSGIHDVWNLTGQLARILNDNADAHTLLNRYDRQRRTIMCRFVQAQTAENKSYMEAGSAVAHARKRQQLEEIAADDELRHAYLLKQSMLQSRLDEAAIQ